MSTQPQGAPKFEIGLAMAGAVSAGAYTAGAMDFLIQALDAWQAEKETAQSTLGDDRTRWPVPAHDVEIGAMSGASAGAMTAALAAVAFCEDHTPVAVPPSPGKGVPNRLYTSWVEDIHVDQLLALPEKRSRGLRSLLNSDVLESIAARASQYQWRGAPRPYVGDGMPLLICVTNLRGVPYSISLLGEPGAEHQMTAHADHIAFTLARPGGGADPDAGNVGWVLHPDQPGDEGWGKLAEAALASGAFPGALAARVLERSPAEYERRLWTIPRESPEEIDGRLQCQGVQPILPSWGSERPGSYRFACVDAGIMNNEPMELARRALAGATRNEREGHRAHRAVVMIDPFPSRAEFDGAYVPETGLGAVLPRLFSSLNAQANFKPEELKLAQDPHVFSRFVIAPTRYETTDAQEGPAEYALAAGTLSNFGGFLAREFREHDFFLGRRNCQQFLRRHFVLPATNPLFRDWSPELVERYKVERDGEAMLPIIPLVGEDLAHPVPQQPWPRLDEARLTSLRPQMRRRVDYIVSIALKQLPSRYYWPLWPLLRIVRRCAVGRIVNAAMDAVRRSLRNRELLS